MLIVNSIYDYYINKKKEEFELERKKEENSLLNYQMKILERNYEIEISSETATKNKFRDFIIIGLTKNKHIMIDMKDVAETIKLKKIVKIGFVNDWFLGISNHNGVLYTILDLNFFYNKTYSDINSSYAIILNNKYKSNLAILCPKIKNLKNENSFTLKDTFTNKKLLIDGIIRSWLDKDNKEFMELNIENFLNSIKVADALEIGVKKN